MIFFFSRIFIWYSIIPKPKLFIIARDTKISYYIFCDCVWGCFLLNYLRVGWIYSAVKFDVLKSFHGIRVSLFFALGIAPEISIPDVTIS